MLSSIIFLVVITTVSSAIPDVGPTVPGSDSVTMPGPTVPDSEGLTVPTPDIPELDLSKVSSPLDIEIAKCVANVTAFTATEEKYIDLPADYSNQVELIAPNVPIQQQVYEKEKRQRVFECLENTLDKKSKKKLNESVVYQALVKKCKLGQIVDFGPACDNTNPYRTISGACNNLKYPNWGASLNCLNRLLPANYEGASGFRQSVCGGPLPEPRDISVLVHTDKKRPSTDVSHMFTFSGMLVAHDSAVVPLTFVNLPGYMNCCAHAPEDRHPQCAPIHLKDDDPFYSKSGVTCLNLVRTALCDTCTVGKRAQIAGPTTLIDCSFIYGLTDLDAATLRTHLFGRLLSLETKCGEELLTPSTYRTICGCVKCADFCFRSGDHLVNLSPPSMGLQIIFMREHNRLADELHKRNPLWDDEKLYQEARKINIAEWQSVVYREFLPPLIGPDLMSKYDLLDKGEGYTSYDETVDPSLIAEFVSAAFRLHTLVNGYFTNHSLPSCYDRVRHGENRVQIFYRGKMDQLMTGLCNSPGQKFDRFMDFDITNLLLRVRKFKYGYDLASVHITRCRDNGLPPYVDLVKLLLKKNIKTFEDLEYLMDPDSIELLKSVYCDVKDIDLWVGLMNERVSDDMHVGPTTAEIIAIQLSRMQYGDRFFWTHEGNFNEDQLKSLRKTSFANVMCRNLNIDSIQPKALQLPGDKNPMKKCSDIPDVDLDLWKDDPLGVVSDISERLSPDNSPPSLNPSLTS